VAFELTSDQARGIWRLRGRFPGAEVRTHARPWGLIVEVSAPGGRWRWPAWITREGSARTSPCASRR